MFVWSTNKEQKTMVEFLLFLLSLSSFWNQPEAGESSSNVLFSSSSSSSSSSSIPPGEKEKRTFFFFQLLLLFFFPELAASFQRLSQTLLPSLPSGSVISYLSPPSAPLPPSFFPRGRCSYLGSSRDGIGNLRNFFAAPLLFPFPPGLRK